MAKKVKKTVKKKAKKIEPMSAVRLKYIENFDVEMSGCDGTSTAKKMMIELVQEIERLNLEIKHLRDVCTEIRKIFR